MLTRVHNTILEPFEVYDTITACIDPWRRTLQYGHLVEHCDVEIVEHSQHCATLDAIKLLSNRFAKPSFLISCCLA